MIFGSPWWLPALAVVPWLVWRARRTRGERPGLRFSAAEASAELPRTGWARLRGLPSLLLLSALTLSIVALARPQVEDARSTRTAEGIDIVLALDASTSMSAEDFYPTRFEAAREVAADFIRGRRSDRIGLVVFAAQAYTQAPLTLDYSFLQQMLREVRMGLIEDGTAIGTAIATATARLRDSDAESRVLILLTDGQNNRGQIDPLTAAEAAAQFGVTIYPVGVGSDSVPLGIQDLMPGLAPQIDEETLREVASLTGGRYFRATDTEALREIYDEIARLETTEIESETVLNVDERYPWLLGPALALLGLSVLLSSTRLRRVP